MLSEDDIKKNFGRIVADLRHQFNLTQLELAEKLKLSVRTVVIIETGKVFPKCETLVQICRFFNISPCVLFTPKVHILKDKNTDYKNEIIKLLPCFEDDRLREIYNFLVVMNK